MKKKKKDVSNVSENGPIYFPFSHPFAFASLLSFHPEFAKVMIENFLNIEIDHLEVVETEKAILLSPTKKSVRFDVYAKEANGRSFDVELQVKKEEFIANRSRYYHANMTMNELKRGKPYDKLPESAVIFLCLNHPFKGSREGVYRFRMKEDSGIDVEFNDGQLTMIVDCKEKEEILREKGLNELSMQVINFLTDNRVEGEFVVELKSELDRLNDDYDWRKTAMTFEDELRREKRESYEEGSIHTRREDVLAMIRRDKDKNPGIKDEEILADFTTYMNVTEDTVRECLQEYYQSLEE